MAQALLATFEGLLGHCGAAPRHLRLGAMHSDSSAPTGAPLAGVRVLDLTRLLPGPVATMHLADLGADVIKIEDTGAGDYASPTVRALVNRNKRGLRLDLKQPAGVQALLQLCRGADVLVEGFRPGVMQRLGLGYEVLSAVNPRLVMCSLSGWGASGPLRDLPGHDLNYTALSGVADQMGGLSNLPIGDLLGGSMSAVMGVLAALFDAARTGRGRHVDIAIADGVLAHAVLPLAALHEHGAVTRPGEGALTGALACYGLYDTADGRQIAVGALERKFWDALCARLERPDLAPLHRRGDAQTEARVRAALAAIFVAQPLAHWAALFAAVPACVTPVLRLDEALAHPHFRARGMAGPEQPAQLGCAVRMSGFAPVSPRAAPRPGQHSHDVLAEAGFGSDDIAALRAAGVLG
jgi:crotonobetainyl-CoA:carnitine CoA-transferase CaiB-like acyl-CoA transferase